MTTAEGWTAAVRDRLSPGRLLPLGTTADGAWITERAVREMLGRAAWAVRGVVPGALRIRPADAAEDPGPGGLLVTASFGAIAGRPLPELVEELRAALLAAAEGGLGLVVGAVDLRVAELLDAAPPEPDAGAAPPPGPTSPATDDPVALAALGVAGVAAVTDTLGPPVRRGPDGVRVELAVTAGARPLDVARAVRTAVTAAVPEDAAVTVVVSDLR
ncbi:hypothetical protein ACFT0G_30270 [Streptomyces sp. NPDC057020]|uniref:hypothetical protein n=1 Tax=unclassified Streptomyces TaxID=2593676 RepID=UPI00093CBA26|nr:hypothetical protein [Streptomyces sp. CB02009]OKJ51375.1 hypothetical protein AMK27_34060 [Streptomyces sp. CB02009]